MATQDSTFDSTADGFTLTPLTTSGSGESSASSYFDLESTEPLPEISQMADDQAGWDALVDEEVQVAAAPLSPTAEHSIWLNGNVLMCGCPECQSPMTIRLWLLLADCWRCGTTIELSEQQEREARRLLDRAQAAAPAESRTERRSERSERRIDPAAPTPPTAAPPPVPTSPDTQPRPARRRRRRRGATARAATTNAWARAMLKDTPAWVISLLIHLVLLTLLGIWHLHDEQDERLITLSTTASKDVREGGNIIEASPEEAVDFDLPIPPQVDLDNKDTREALVRADQDARELRLDPNANEPKLPSLDIVKSEIRQAGELRRTLAARDPRIRVEMIQKEGGTTLTEAAVARGLRWLSIHQNANGSWSLHAFNKRGGCTCNGTGLHSDSAGTALTLLPFLGAGQTHFVGKYKDNVARGLRWMVENQGDDGDLRVNSRGNSGMYAHGQATIVLCEAFLMTGDEKLREPAQKAVEFIVKAQHPAGGWRYRPGEAGDTSVLGWQLMALQSARAANLEVPAESFALADHYLDTVQRQNGALYSYQRGRPPTDAMTAEALLCRIYNGWRMDEPGLMEGAGWLIDNHLPSEKRPNIYYWYYGTQTMHHIGGPMWKKWNLQMRDILVNTQRRRGHMAGSWDPRGPHASSGGRIYMTALSVCSLEVYYRHLPLFKQIELDE
ncbi:MAG: terpene cyclase/mutase family protein [Pirellulaceae bacterium]|jgi:hypothetical protein|nr:terpene cyclase/mutase family protein [Pirellulaceae bacterium]MDP7015866.1 terpene cyclase/mutase family protein [Pirellulaceae bacterium]